MNTKKPSLLKQLLGAIIGGSLAVGLYYTYELSAPIVSGYLINAEKFPQLFSGEEPISNQNDLSDDRQARIAAKVRRAITIESSDTLEEPVHAGAPQVAPNTFTATVVAPTYEQTLPEPTVTTVRTSIGPERVIAEEITTTTTETITETRISAPQLPDSGLPIAVIASGLAGSMFGIRKLQK